MVTAFDLDKQVVAAIKGGTLRFPVDQQPYPEPESNIAAIEKYAATAPGRCRHRRIRRRWVPHPREAGPVVIELRRPAPCPHMKGVTWRVVAGRRRGAGR